MIMVGITKEGFRTQAAFRYAIRRFLRISEKNSKVSGITHQQYQLLLSIKGMNDREWATISELAESLQILHHSAADLCKRAERIGLITTTRHKTDRRNVCVHLTKRGEKLMAAVALENRRELVRLQENITKMFAESLLT
jgi:DNA-binding MarR family transcriptional regulator